MPHIQCLPPHVADLIAAGEVVERPASVGKALMENSIDAGAKNRTVEISGGGRSLIRVTDDGCGMSADDAGVAFLRHATSKITTPVHRDRTATLGFRGEALASIAAVAQVELMTRRKEDELGTKILIEGSVVKEQLPKPMSIGTNFTVKKQQCQIKGEYN